MTCVFTWKADVLSVESVLATICITYIDYIQEQYICDILTLQHNTWN